MAPDTMTDRILCCSCNVKYPDYTTQCGGVNSHVIIKSANAEGRNLQTIVKILLILVLVGGTIINVLSVRSQAAVAWEQSSSVFCLTAIIAMDNVPSVDNH